MGAEQIADAIYCLTALALMPLNMFRRATIEFFPHTRTRTLVSMASHGVYVMRNVAIIIFMNCVAFGVVVLRRLLQFHSSLKAVGKTEFKPYTLSSPF